MNGKYGARYSQAQSKKKTTKKKNREIEACLVDQSITAILAEEKKKRLCVCVCACVRACVCVCV